MPECCAIALHHRPLRRPARGSGEGGRYHRQRTGGKEAAPLGTRAEPGSRGEAGAAGGNAGAGTCLRGDELSKECRLFLSETFVRFVFFVVK